MTVKGQEFPAYDSRGIQGMGLAYATSNRGACHLRGYTVACEVLGIPVKTDPLRDRRQGRAGQGVPGRDGGVRFVGPVRLHVVRLDARRRAAAAAGGLRRRLVDGEAGPGRRADLEPGARSSTTPPASPRRTTTCRRGSRPSRRRPVRPRVSSTASTRCCPNTTSCAAGRRTACRRRKRCRAWACPPERRTGRIAAPAAIRPPRAESTDEARHHRQRSGRASSPPRRCASAIPTTTITLIGDEPEPPYSRMAIPYLMMGDIDEAGTYLRKDAGPFRAAAASTLLHGRVDAVDTKARSVRLADGSDAGVRPAADRHGLARRSARRSPASTFPACTPAGRWRTRAASSRARCRARACCRSAPASSAASSWRRSRAAASISPWWRWATAWCRA